ncbi:2-hydroxymuconate tautomerase family protein [Oleidesulfovibrio sp.]|uniref:2-hydroxymuconate tautomerase family protein n=1 Tax=Oleidesulfovibrio sp. TaxID=2909707 RepID=UPI003A863199
MQQQSVPAALAPECCAACQCHRQHACSILTAVSARLFISTVPLHRRVHMPVIRVELWEGRTLEQKRELVKVLTRETARITGCGKASVYVIIDEVKKENWGAGGELCSEKYPE